MKPRVRHEEVNALGTRSTVTQLSELPAGFAWKVEASNTRLQMFASASGNCLSVEQGRFLCEQVTLLLEGVYASGEIVRDADGEALCVPPRS